MVSRQKRRAPVEVKALSRRSRAIYAQTVGAYGIGDLGGQMILVSGLRSKDLAEVAEAVLEQDGPVVRDRWGQPRAHPAAAVARDARAAWLAALRALNLAIGDVPKAGRPEGS
jgi:hypothetical protein